ncbi:MAG: hypothetical protein QF832_18525, partial [SAR324 cluster bacterium]|nr:hypothetical protein [SAR324 cluster bacterium]
MENGTEPKRTISLTWDDPWKKYEERWRKNPRGEGKPLLYSDISRTERPRRKKSKFRKQSLSSNGVNRWKPYL